MPSLMPTSRSGGAGGTSRSSGGSGRSTGSGSSGGTERASGSVVRFRRGVGGERGSGNGTPARLRCVGFVSADDSVDPRRLALMSAAYPWVEWGVYFRPDKEGQPRYPTAAWRARLSDLAAKNPQVKLAAHLCGAHVNHLLAGDTFETDTFLSSLEPLGFRRVQIHASSSLGADPTVSSDDEAAFKASNLAQAMAAHPKLEFVLRSDDETRHLWDAMARVDGEGGGRGGLPPNVSLLEVGEEGWRSSGAMMASSSAANDAGEGGSTVEANVGYAGGITSDNIFSILGEVSVAAGGREFWINVEHGVRSVKDGQDVFDLDKVYACVDEVCKEAGLKKHPTYLC